jgi:hypothetical protein
VDLTPSENGESGFQRRFAKYLTGRMRKLKNTKGGALADERTLNYYSAFIRDGFLAILQE